MSFAQWRLIWLGRYEYPAHCLQTQSQNQALFLFANLGICHYIDGL